MGFFVICAGVVLLQLSKSAKDVPDTAVFSGDLDQVRTIAEQEQPESEPKADAIRGAGLGTIVRQFSVTRQRMEEDELKRLHDEKQAELASINENGGEQYEWDGIRRRRTTLSKHSVNSFRPISRPYSTADSNIPEVPRLRTPGGTPRQAHPPLGMSHFPSYDEIPEDEEARPSTAGLRSSFFGSIRNRARSAVQPGTSTRDFARQAGGDQSPMHPVALTEITPPRKSDYYEHTGNGQDEHVYGLPSTMQQHTAYEGAGSPDRNDHKSHIHFAEVVRPGTGQSSLAPEPPAHARRQFSFHNVFRKGDRGGEDEAITVTRKAPGNHGSWGPKPPPAKTVKGATEEERLGLVKGDSRTGMGMKPYGVDGEVEDGEGEYEYESSPRDSSDSWELEVPRQTATGAVASSSSSGRGLIPSHDRDDEDIAMAVPVPVIERGRGRGYSVEEDRELRRNSGQGVERFQSIPMPLPSQPPPQVLGNASRSGSDEDEYAKRRQRWQKQGGLPSPSSSEQRGSPGLGDWRGGGSGGGSGNGGGAFV